MNKIKVDKENLKEFFCKVYNASDGHYFDSDECWYCGFRDGVLAVLTHLLKKGTVYVEDRRVHSNISRQMLLDMYLEIKDEQGTNKFNR